MKKNETEKKVAAPSKRKQYDLPGQIHDPPVESEPLRIFYETLLQQRPDSEMAQIWMMENGLLDEEDAARALKLKHNRNRNGPVASSSQNSGGKTPVRGASKTPPAPARKVAPPARATKSATKASPKPVPLGRKPARPKYKEESEEEEEEEESDEDVPLTKRSRR